jgi:hypothetical protein
MSNDRQPRVAVEVQKQATFGTLDLAAVLQGMTAVEEEETPSHG